VRVWDTRQGTERFVLAGHREVITSVDFSSDGRRLLSSDSRGTIKLWDLETGVETLSLRGSIGYLVSARWSPDGVRVVAISNGKILTWDATIGYQLESNNGTRALP
jgi:WD40 repeat protein